MRISVQQFIYWNLFVDSIGWSISIPCLPSLQQSFFGMNSMQIAMITSFLSILVFVCGIIQGSISDYIGRVSMLQLSAIFQLLGHLLIIIAMNTHSVNLFFISRCLPSLLKCGMVVSQALLYDVNSSNDISKDIATLLAYSSLAYIVGPILGGQAYIISPFLPFYIGILVSIINLVLIVYLSDQLKVINRHKDKSDKTAKASSNSDKSKKANLLINYLHIKFAFQIGNTLFESFFAQHIKINLKLDEAYIGWLLSYSGIISILANGYLLNEVITSFDKPESVLWPFCIILGIGLVGWSLSTTLVELVVSITIITISSNLFLSIIQSVIAQTEKQNELLFSLINYKNDNPSSKNEKSNLLNYYIRNRYTLLNSYSSIDLLPTISPFIDEEILQHVQKDLIINNNKNNIGTIFGLSSTADRAARIIAPLIGGYFLDLFGVMGFVYISLLSMTYCIIIIFISLPIRDSNSIYNNKILKKYQKYVNIEEPMSPYNNKTKRN